MKNESYISIQGWMRNELNLKGNELIVYALVYGFCQDGESEFSGSSKYVMDWIGSTQKTALAALKSLTDKGLLIKKENGSIKTVSYAINRNYSGMVKITVGQEKLENSTVKTTVGHRSFYSDSTVKITANNTIYNTNYNTNNKREGTRSQKPTLEEVRAYCQERQNSVDPERFIDYYEGNGWMRGKNKIKDWKACVRTWEKNGYDDKKKTNSSRNSWNNFQQREYDYDELERQLLGN